MKIHSIKDSDCVLVASHLVNIKARGRSMMVHGMCLVSHIQNFVRQHKQEVVMLNCKTNSLVSIVLNMTSFNL